MKKDQCNHKVWVDASIKMPVHFKLVEIKYDSGKIAIGWWNGFNWDGARVVNEKVEAWRRTDYQMITAMRG